MKLSFLPGQLFLESTADGLFRVSSQGQEIVRTHSKKIAVAKFNALRDELEKAFPQRPATEEEKRIALQKSIVDGLVGHSSIGGRKKKTTAGSTRTFGG